MGKGLDLDGIDAVGNVPGLAFLGEDHGAAEFKAGHDRERDAGGFDGQDLVDALPVKQPVQFFCHFVHQHGVELVVEKAVNLENPAGLHLAVAQYALFQQFHFKVLLIFICFLCGEAACADAGIIGADRLNRKKPVVCSTGLFRVI